MRARAAWVADDHVSMRRAALVALRDSCVTRARGVAVSLGLRAQFGVNPSKCKILFALEPVRSREAVIHEYTRQRDPL